MAILEAILTSVFTVSGGALLAYYKWSYDDFLSREKILLGFKYEIEILNQRIVHLINREENAWFRPL